MNPTDQSPPSSSDEPPATDEELASLAAGEIEASRAAALRATAATDPVLASRLAEAEKLEARLRGEELLPVPLAMLADVLERVRAEPSPAWVTPAESAPTARVLSNAQRALRVAAAILLAAVGFWVTLGGFEPVAATAGTIAAVTPSALPATSWLASVSGADRLPSIDGLIGKGGDVASLSAAVSEDVLGSAAGWLVGSVVFLAAGLCLAWRLSMPGPALRTPRSDPA